MENKTTNSKIKLSLAGFMADVSMTRTPEYVKFIRDKEVLSLYENTEKYSKMDIS